MNKEKLALQRDSKNSCIISGCKKKGKRTRGLCRKHHSRYHRIRELLSEEERQTFDDRLIELGMLLPSNQGRRTDEPDEFESVAREMFATFKDPLTSKVVKEIEERSRE